MDDYNDGEFHLWHGGDCPVHPQTVVDVRLRVQHRGATEGPANKFTWRHGVLLGGYNEYEIICFRVVKPYRAPVYLPDEIGPDHPAVKAYRDAYLKTDSDRYYDLIAAGLNAALKVLREGGE